MKRTIRIQLEARETVANFCPKCGAALDDARLDGKAARTPLRCGQPHRQRLRLACCSFPK